MARYLIEDIATGLLLKRFGGLGSDHYWTSDPLEAWSDDDPKMAAFRASDQGYGEGVNRPFKIKRLVVSTRDVAVEPYTEDEYWARTVRNGPQESLSVRCPQCRALAGQPCINPDDKGRYPAGAVHGLRRRDFLNREAVKAEKTGRPNPYAALRP